MNVVIDTNVLVSGLLTPFGNPSEILRLVALGKVSICYDARIIAEYHEVLKRPTFKFNQETVSLLIKEFQLTGEFTVGVPLNESLPDKDDNMFLEVALGSNAECIITGNLHHFPKGLCFDIKIYSPSDFLNFYKQGRI